MKDYESMMLATLNVSFCPRGAAVVQGLTVRPMDRGLGDPAVTGLKPVEFRRMSPILFLFLLLVCVRSKNRIDRTKQDLFAGFFHQVQEYISKQKK